MTGAVGMIEVPDMASQILRQDKADVVIFAREFLRRPYWPLEEASEMGVPLTWPAQYLRAAPNVTTARGPVFPKLPEAAEKDVATAQGRRS